MSNQPNNSEYLDPRTVRFREEYQGKHFFTKDGKQEFVITDARSYGDVDIEFIGSGIKKNTKVGNIKNGLPNPFFAKAGCRGGYCPVAFDTPQHQYEGCQYRSNEGDLFVILKYEGTAKITYQFLDEFGYTGVTTLQNIKKGQVANPFHRNAVGGYTGTNTVYCNLEYKWLHSLWYAMLTRATGKRAQYAASCNSYMNVKSYENITFDPAWYCFSSFAEWYMSFYNNLNHNYQYNVDKDLLFPYYSAKTQGRKCYGPQTCIIIPKVINVEIANYASVSDRNKPLIRNNLKLMCESLYKDYALDLDAYNIIKRFYLEDPEYSNYVTTRMNLIQQIYF